MQHRRLIVIATVPAAARPETYAAITQFDGPIEVRVGWDGDQIEAYAANADAEVVIAAGGDGTINRVVAGLLRNDVPPALAVFPGGTANDFATALNVPLDMAGGLALAASGRIVPIDVGFINDRPFINVASAGPAAEATTDVSPTAKKWLGGLAYTLKNMGQLANLPVIDATFHGPEYSWQGGINGFCVANGSLAGGGVRVAPHALISDGRLDLTIAPPLEAQSLGAAITDFFKPAWDADFEHLIYKQIATLQIETAEPIRINLDGEPIDGDRFEVRIAPGRLNLVAPVQTELLLKNR